MTSKELAAALNRAVMTPMHVPETREDMARALYDRQFGDGYWEVNALFPEAREEHLREADFVLALIAAAREQQRTVANGPVVFLRDPYLDAAVHAFAHDEALVAGAPAAGRTEALADAAVHRLCAVLRAGPDAAEMTTNVLGRW